MPQTNLTPKAKNIMTIAKGEVRKEPLKITLSEKESALHLSIESGAELTVIIQLSGENHAINLAIGDNAHVECICLCDDIQCDAVTVSQRSTLGRNASVHFRNVTLNDAKITHDLVSEVQGELSESTVDWIFYGKNTDEQHLSARNVFDAKAGRGEISMNGVVEDHAQTTCNGMIEITKNGAKTTTYLTEKTLMLDKTAYVNAIPGLEIKTNDVRASHSATVTKVSDEDLFYFASRGIEEIDARKMYIEGFLGGLVDNIHDKKIQKKILESITKKYTTA